MGPRRKESLREKERRMLPFFVEFLKFISVFAIIITTSLLVLRFAIAGMQ